jgi:hypothetical protein
MNEDPTDEEIEASIQKEINNWKKRLNRKGPFYLYKNGTINISRGMYTDPDDASSEWIVKDYRVSSYFCIWNDKHKTKYGYFHDEMATRYGVNTICVLNGDTKFDLWNGSAINDDIFDRMLEVRHDISKLPLFNLDTIKDLII